MAQFVLHRGADVRAEGGFGGSPYLYEAVMRGKELNTTMYVAGTIAESEDRLLEQAMMWPSMRSALD